MKGHDAFVQAPYDFMSVSNDFPTKFNTNAGDQLGVTGCLGLLVVVPNISIWFIGYSLKHLDKNVGIPWVLSFILGTSTATIYNFSTFTGSYVSNFDIFHTFIDSFLGAFVSNIKNFNLLYQALDTSDGIMKDLIVRHSCLLPVTVASFIELGTGVELPGGFFVILGKFITAARIVSILFGGWCLCCKLSHASLVLSVRFICSSQQFVRIASNFSGSALWIPQPEKQLTYPNGQSIDDWASSHADVLISTFKQSFDKLFSLSRCST